MRALALLVIVVGACHRDAPRKHHEDRAEPAAAAPALALAVMVGGEPATWGADAFAKVPKLDGKATSGEARDVWSLRALAEALVGPGARVVSVTGPDGTVPIAAAAWSDPARSPILHTTRRGSLKFRWARPDGSWEETVVRDVSALALVR